VEKLHSWETRKLDESGNLFPPASLPMGILLKQHGNLPHRHAGRHPPFYPFVGAMELNEKSVFATSAPAPRVKPITPAFDAV